MDSKKYWEDRYKNGGHSGDGSFARLAYFKANVLNKFVKANRINTVVDFGCGDGSQLVLYDFPMYTGLDVSSNIIDRNTSKFNPQKYVFLPYPSDVHGFDLSLSIDVIYHLLEDDVYNDYMNALFNASNRFVIIYSTNDPFIDNQAKHIKHRRFTDWIKIHKPIWELIKVKKNDYPYKGDTVTGSHCDFYIYKKNKHNGTTI
jgi:cyclopropane fatty-acyl-phospholipid synthase-like methyltransferase